MKTASLTPRQRRFVEEYVTDLNGTQAAIRAGYSTKGARVRGTELLTNRNIQKAVETAMEQRRLRTELKADDVVRRLAIVAFASVSDFITWTDGEVRLRPSEGIDKAKLVGVHSITRGPHGVTIRMHDKIRALELLAKHLGMFRERNELDLRVTSGADVVGRLMGRLDEYAARAASGKTNAN